MRKLVKRPDVDQIRDLLVERLDAQFMGLRIVTIGNVDSLTVDLYGRTSSGPVLDFEDLKKIKGALVGYGAESDVSVLITAGVCPDDGWSYIQIHIDTQDLKDEVCIITDK